MLTESEAETVAPKDYEYAGKAGGLYHYLLKMCADCGGYAMISCTEEDIRDGMLEKIGGACK